ncbi:tripartite tricarboxylate transporter TctB family protein [Alphaproteobacteria bacterium KMM 3653]|uniref:Tripartite tricarboxylate transporter TctB family protein n=1 Tax=Harenicola maris TaxID=2841044 RepID=A0AAP2G8T9_9RHOB|nr:tripartite tricarboxylate transporter TctB family protein [Harenicola maris]
MSPTPNNPEEAEAAGREVINDLVSGGLCLALASGLAVVHYSQAGRLHDDFNRDPGPALLPVILLAALALAGAGLGLRGWIALAKARAFPPLALHTAWPAGLAVLLMASFLPLREVIGAAIALPLICGALAVLAGRGEAARWPVTAALGEATGLALYGLFHFGLSVPL